MDDSTSLMHSSSVSSTRRDSANNIGVMTVSALDSARLQLEYETRMRGNAVLANVREAPKRKININTKESNNNTERRSSWNSFLMYAFLVSILIIIIGLGAYLSNRNRRGDKDNELTDLQYLQNIFHDISGEDSLLDKKSPQYQALNWLVENDTYFPDIQNLSIVEDLKERYTVVVLYFSTGGPTNWIDQFEFLSNTSVCDWPHNAEHISLNKSVPLFGIECNRRRQVSSVDLRK